MTARLPLWRRLGWVIGAVAGLGVAVGAGFGVQEVQEEREARDVARRLAAFERVGQGVPEPVDAVRDLLAQPGHVVVDPLLADRVPVKDLARVERVLAGARTPSHVAYLSVPESESGYTTSGAAAQWAEGVGVRGHYVVLFDDGRHEIVALGLEEEYLSTRTKGQPGPALLRIARKVVSWEAEERQVRPVHGQDDWGGISGGIWAFVLAGGLLVVPAFFTLRHVLVERRKDT